MKISIITVSYNSDKTIADTLNSALTQTYPNIEHIVIDGGSRDKTMSIVNSYKNSLGMVVSEVDNGIYNAMNKGLKLATGDVVGFLNSDDVFADENVLMRIADSFKKNPLASVVYGDIIYVSSKSPEKVVRVWNSGVFSKNKLKYGWMPPHPTFYVRRSVVADIGEFREELKISADYDFMLRTLNRLNTVAVYIPRVLVRMRLGGASNTSLRAMLKKSREDLFVLRSNQVGGFLTLFFKNFRKVGQFFKSK